METRFQYKGLKIKYLSYYIMEGLTVEALQSLPTNKIYETFDGLSEEDQKTYLPIFKQVMEMIPWSDDMNDTDYQSLPMIKDPEFQQKLFSKREFYSNQLFLNTVTDDSCNLEFSIKPHQIVLKNYMTKESPYKSLLVYHGVGVGKTCSGITVAENFRDMYAKKEKRILILCSKNIQIGWKQTIYNPERGSEQCTGDTFTESGATTKRKVSKLIKQYYEIMAYQSFSNYVTRMSEKYAKTFPKEQYDLKKQEWIRTYFSDRLLIIDEAHNIRDDQGSDMRDVVKTIENVVTYSDNMKLILLTATPMFNRSTEVIWMINMMLLNDNRPTINYKDVFTKQGELKRGGEKLLEEASKGYISYLRGENPITFPLRLFPSQLKLYPSYDKQSKVSVILPNHTPSLNLVGAPIKPADRFTFLELFGSQINNLQLEVYNRAIENIKESDTIDLDMRGEKNPILDNVVLSQISNIVYPIEDVDISEIRDGTIDLTEFYGNKGLRNCMNKRGNSYTYKQTILDTYGPIFDKDRIGDYSSKIKSILELVEKSEGIVFIYSKYIDSGTVPLQLALEQNGYGRSDNKTILNYKDKREPISYDGLRKSEVEEGFQQANYMVIDGNTNKKTLEEDLARVVSKDNMYGQKIKVIIGSVVASEGLDFKRIRNIHILDPWLHLNRIEQTVGRGIRFCSHADLDETEKNVLVFLHSSTLKDDRESIDTSVYRYAEKKSLQIGTIETILKKNAVDRYLYENINVITKGSIIGNKMKPPHKDVSLIKVEYSDKPYSKTCSYMKDCDYNKQISVDSERKLNGDTFLQMYSSNLIYNIKKYIASLFKDFYVFTIDSILGCLSEYTVNQNILVYYALDDMITNKTKIFDKRGNSGYIIQKRNFYLFQPFLYEDISLPLYYRFNLKQTPTTSLKLDPIVKNIEYFKPSESYNDIEDILNYINQYMDLDAITGEKNKKEICNQLSKVEGYETFKNILNPITVGFILDRLTVEQKFSLFYAYFTIPPEGYDPVNKQLVTIIYGLLEPYIIYKSNTGEEYYFNGMETNERDVFKFGFFLSQNHKPFFYEVFEGNKIYECDKVQKINIDKSIKKYSKTSHFKLFRKNSKLWGYTTLSKKGGKSSIVLKIAQPSFKGKAQTIKYPPGPGNVCIENNIASRRENLETMIEIYFEELNEVMVNPLFKNKRELCYLIEILMRFNSELTFYSLDQMWLKYI